MRRRNPAARSPPRAHDPSCLRSAACLGFWTSFLRCCAACYRGIAFPAGALPPLVTPAAAVPGTYTRRSSTPCRIFLPSLRTHRRPRLRWARNPPLFHCERTSAPLHLRFQSSAVCPSGPAGAMVQGPAFPLPEAHPRALKGRRWSLEPTLAQLHGASCRFSCWACLSAFLPPPGASLPEGTSWWSEGLVSPPPRWHLICRRCLLGRNATTVFRRHRKQTVTWACKCDSRWKPSASRAPRPASRERSPGPGRHALGRSGQEACLAGGRAL